MNLHIYIEDTLMERLALCTKKFQRKRNSIVREAIKDWIERHTEKKWPQSIMEFKGIADFPDIKELRSGLLEPKKDLF